MRITVFTPAYNRAYIIEKLYRSLQRQAFSDFEWVVVDDGSKDNTEELFRQFCAEENAFPIVYRKVENGGKHRAINHGVELAKGELFYIVDSDDYLTDDALAVIDAMEKTIPSEDKGRFAGVCGLKVYENQTMIGASFLGEVLDCTALDRIKHGIKGDKAEVFYTEIMKKYPFPAFEGEKFITECVVWDKMAYDGYLLRFFNKPTMICEYLPDGLTCRGDEIFIKNPKGYGLFLFQSAKFKKQSFMTKWKSYEVYANYLLPTLSYREIAKNLHANPLMLRAVFLSFRIFRKMKSILVK